MDELITQAKATAEQLLAPTLPRRWRHVQAVARKAAQLGCLVGEDVPVLVASAWLHDIGYAPSVTDSGFHSLDGARWLVRAGFDIRISSLVAYHSCAPYEAAERGLATPLAAEFPREESTISDALCFADMTTGPDGQSMTAEERLAEIRERYGPEDLVTRFWRRAEPALMEVVRRMEDRMARQPMCGSLLQANP